MLLGNDTTKRCDIIQEMICNCHGTLMFVFGNVRQSVYYFEPELKYLNSFLVYHCNILCRFMIR